MQIWVWIQRTAPKAGQSGTKLSITALDHPQKGRGSTNAHYWYSVARNGPARTRSRTSQVTGRHEYQSSFVSSTSRSSKPGWGKCFWRRKSIKVASNIRLLLHCFLHALLALPHMFTNYEFSSIISTSMRFTGHYISSVVFTSEILLYLISSEQPLVNLQEGKSKYSQFVVQPSWQVQRLVQPPEAQQLLHFGNRASWLLGAYSQN
jgi:hypothetical protein